MREEFEKLPEISERLHTVVYNEDFNQYHAAMINSRLSVKYIQGAWYAYQEQQKKLDKLSCNHLWTGKSENQYCSKCGEVD